VDQAWAGGAAWTVLDSRQDRSCTAQNRTMGEDSAWLGEYLLAAPAAHRFLRWNFTAGVGGNANG